jgi:uncharacterized protein YrrD
MLTSADPVLACMVVQGYHHHHHQTLKYNDISQIVQDQEFILI